MTVNNVTNSTNKLLSLQLFQNMLSKELCFISLYGIFGLLLAGEVFLFRLIPMRLLTKCIRSVLR